MMKKNALKNIIHYHFKTRPRIHIGMCNACGTCKATCKVRAVDLFAYVPNVDLPPKTGEPRFRPQVNYSKCTRCYKCRKACPRSAIEKFRPWILRVLGRDA